VPTYSEIVAGLGRLQSFEASAFVGDDEWPQGVCDLVLSLAVAYNDLRDVILAHSLMDAVFPADPQTPTPELGHFNGLVTHLVRLQAGIAHELLVLVQNQKAARNASAFTSLVGKLSPSGRLAWDQVVAVAEGKPGTGPLGDFLFFARNKVAFHYDPKELRKGYRASFTEDPSRKPFFSHGGSMALTRFYFGDAAVDTYMRKSADPVTVERFFGGDDQLLRSVHMALHELVTRFLLARTRGGSRQLEGNLDESAWPGTRHAFEIEGAESDVRRASCMMLPW